MLEDEEPSEKSVIFKENYQNLKEGYKTVSRKSGF